MDTISGLDSILREVVEPAVYAQFKVQIPELNMLTEKDVDGGEYWKCAIPTEGNVSAMSHIETGYLPVPGNVEVSEFHVTPKIFVATAQITQLINAQATGKGSIIDGVKLIQEDLVRQFKGMFPRKIVGHPSGVSGVVAVVADASGGSTTVTSRWHGTGEGKAATDACEPGTRYLKKGMAIAIGTSGEIIAGTANLVKVSSITDKEKFVVNSSIAQAAGDLVVVYNQRTQASGEYGADYAATQRDLTPLTKHIHAATGAYQGLPDRSVYPSTAGNVFDDAAGYADGRRVLNTQLMLDASQAAEIRGFDRQNRILVGYDVMNAYFNMLQPAQSITGLAFDAHWKTLSWNGIQLDPSPNAIYGSVKFLNLDTLLLLKWGNAGFFKGDGANMYHWIAGTTMQQVIYNMIVDLGCTIPGANTLLRDIVTTPANTAF